MSEREPAVRTATPAARRVVGAVVSGLLPPLVAVVAAMLATSVLIAAFVIWLIA